MSLYRVMVSGAQEYWETMEIEADTIEEAEAKALEKAAAKEEIEWNNSTGLKDIRIEGVEVLETEIPKSSDLAWSGSTSEGEEPIG
jgi:hypothetical protein